MRGTAAKRALVGGVAAVAIGVGVVAPVGATTDPLSPVTAAASSLEVPYGMSIQTLIAARNAGFPIYEAAEKVLYQAPKRAFWMIEYRRVSSDYDLSSPTTKFVTMGTVGPDTFWVSPDSAGPAVINVNRTWYHQDNVGFPMVGFEQTDQRFANSPVVLLPGGGPSVGIALITQRPG
ncbi:hypothetical protein [Rhodococcus sp. NPDC059234]|uniref:hypothetical protein n=1 Tax=Rhodococcus sp. NPDC059234 TaxID=3346781 RepID=UPI00366C38D2